MLTKLIIPAIVIGVIASSCSKSSDSSSATTMNYQITTSNNSNNLMRMTAAATLQWTAGFANPTLVKFEAKKDSSQIEYKSTNTTQIDLFASTASSFGGFTLPAGTYKEVELKIELNNNGTSPALQLSGNFTVGSTTIPVLFQVSEPIEIKTEIHDVTITSGSFTAMTVLDMSTVITGVTEAMLSGATVTGGTIVISASSNTSIYNAILSNLKSHSHHCEFDHH